MSTKTLLAVFATDEWHMHGSRNLLGVTDSIEGAIACINAEQKERGHAPLSEEQEDLLRRIKQTQSGEDIIGEYLVEEVQFWDGSEAREMTCIHCGDTVVFAPDGELVHADPDEDPSAEDYGWVRCCGGDHVAEIGEPVNEVICSICGNRTPESTAHLHAGDWIGDTCCWDERLRSSE
jgi:ribosomal protein S27E